MTVGEHTHKYTHTRQEGYSWTREEEEEGVSLTFSPTLAAGYIETPERIVGTVLESKHIEEASLVACNTSLTSLTHTEKRDAEDTEKQSRFLT